MTKSYYFKKIEELFRSKGVELYLSDEEIIKLSDNGLKYLNEKYKYESYDILYLPDILNLILSVYFDKRVIVEDTVGKNGYTLIFNLKVSSDISELIKFINVLRGDYVGRLVN